MRKNIFRSGGVAGLVILFLYAGCKKDNGYYAHENTIHQFSGNTYDFLKSQVGVYDSFLYVIDKVGLTDSLKDGNYTVFAPTNASFQEAISNMNNLRKAQGRPLLYLATVAEDELDSMTTRYLIRGVPFAYDPLYWGAVFPLGMYTVATFRMAHAMDLDFLQVIPRYFIYFALLAGAVNFIGLLRTIARGLVRKPGMQ